MGSFEIMQSGGQSYPVIMRTDNTHVYFAYGIKIGKLTVPEMQDIFVMETGHSDVITNF